MVKNLFKVAKSFRTKLAWINTIEQIKKVYNAAMDLTQPNIVDLWVKSADYEPMVEAPLNTIKDLASRYYYAATEHGLTKSQSAKYLLDLLTQVDELKDAKMAMQLDPAATIKLNSLKSALDQIVPVSFSAPEKERIIELDEEQDYYPIT